MLLLFSQGKNDNEFQYVDGFYPYIRCQGSYRYLVKGVMINFMELV